MARETRIIEEIGWLKVVFGAAIVVLGPLASWAIMTPDSMLRVVGALGIGGLWAFLMALARRVYDLLRELET